MNKVLVGQLERQIQYLSQLSARLEKLENTLRTEIENIANMRHETAMNAIRHIT